MFSTTIMTASIPSTMTKAPSTMIQATFPMFKALLPMLKVPLLMPKVSFAMYKFFLAHVKIKTIIKIRELEDGDEESRDKIKQHNIQTKPIYVML